LGSNDPIARAAHPRARYTIERKHRKWRDIGDAPDPRPLAELRLRPEYETYWATVEELQPKDWKPDDDNWHPPEAQHELPRHQCCCCGKGLKGTDWLCRNCKTLAGTRFIDEIAHNIGVTPDTLHKAPWPVLTPKGKLATPDELNTGDLEYFQFAVWPKEVKGWKRDEELHRENYTPTRYSWSYDKMLADGYQVAESYALALVNSEEGAELAGLLFVDDDFGPGAIPELPEDAAAFLRRGLEEPDPQADLTSGDYVASGDDMTVAVRHAVFQLTPQQQEHVYMWLRGRTQAEIAEAQGYRRQATVSAHRAKIIKTLRALVLAELGNSRENS
jgi:DNA-binding CsgD family transcriptional regulator